MVVVAVEGALEIVMAWGGGEISVAAMEATKRTTTRMHSRGWAHRRQMRRLTVALTVRERAMAAGSAGVVRVH